MFFNKNKIYPFDTYVVFERCTNTKLIFVLILMKEKKNCTCSHIKIQIVSYAFWGINLEKLYQ